MDTESDQKLTGLKLSPNFIVFLLISAFFLLSYLSMLGKSATYDEVRNYNYGKSILNGNSDRPDDKSILDGTPIAGSMMPVSILNALPLKIGSFLPEGGLRTFLESNATARLITIIFSALTAWLLFYWARSLYGLIPALFSLMFYVFDPNIIAHSQYVTTDMYAWGSTLLVFYCTWKFAHQRNWGNAAAWAGALAIGSLVKYTTVVLLPLSLFAIFLYDLPTFINGIKETPANTIKKFFANYAIYVVISIFISILAINIGFLFNKTFTYFDDYTFYSHFLQSLQQNLPWLANLPLPVPFPYLQGFDLTYYYGAKGLAFGNIYLLGYLGDGTRGFMGYYLIASFFKEPIAIQLFVLAAFYTYLKNKGYKNRFLSDDIFLLLPIFFFIIYFNFFFNINTGIRYYLVFSPLLYVFCGSLFVNWETYSREQKIASAVLIVYLIVSVLSYFPNYVPYFNEFLIDRRKAYKILADSNIDYGQSDNARDSYLESHPAAIYDPAHPTSGTVVLGVNELVGVFGTADDFRWLRENFEPADTIAYTYLVYEISPTEFDRLCKTTEYCK